MLPLRAEAGLGPPALHPWRHLFYAVHPPPPTRSASANGINTKQLKIYIYIYLKTKRALSVQLIDTTAFLFYLDPVCMWRHISTSRRFITGDASRLKEEERTRKKREERVCLALRGRILPQTNHHTVNSSTESSHIHVNPAKGLNQFFHFFYTPLFLSARVTLNGRQWRHHNTFKKTHKHPDYFIVFWTAWFPFIFNPKMCVVVVVLVRRWWRNTRKRRIKNTGWADIYWRHSSFFFSFF